LTLILAVLSVVITGYVKTRVEPWGHYLTDSFFMKNFNLLKIYKTYIVVMAAGVIILSVFSFLRFPPEACAQGGCYAPVIPDHTIVHFRFENIGNGAEVNLTSYLDGPSDTLQDMGLWTPGARIAEEWMCVTGGWAANYDYNEKGKHEHRKWTQVMNNNWWLRVDFAGHSSDWCPSGCQYEDPDVDVICFHQSVLANPKPTLADKEM